MKRKTFSFLALLLAVLLLCSLPVSVSAASSPAAESAETVALQARWNEWKLKSRRSSSDDLKFDRAFRRLYATDPDVMIQNHVVYVKAKEKEKTVWQLVDFFDTNQAEKTTTKLVLPARIQGLPVRISMFCQSQDSRWPGDGRFRNNTVKQLVLSGNWKELQPFSFSSFTALQSVKLPDSLTTIGWGAFQNCSALKTVSGAKKLSAVNQKAFLHCKSLSDFPAVANVTRFASACFQDTGFRSLVLKAEASFPNTLETGGTGSRQFAACEKLKTVVFSEPKRSKTVLTIATEQFKRCGNLKKVTLPAGGKGVVIGPMAFQDCAALQSVKNTAKITNIHRRAFYNCRQLSAVVLSKQLKFAKWDAFLNCTGLKTLRLNGILPGVFRANEDLQGFSSYAGNNTSCNFVKHLPAACTVYVSSEAMQRAVSSRGFRGNIVIAA